MSAKESVGVRVSIPDLVAQGKGALAEGEREHRHWVTTTNPLERYIREVRRRSRPMGTFQGLASCRLLIYVAVLRLSNERRNAIPYSLWTSQPGYGTRRRRTRPRGQPDLDALRKELRLALRSWYLF